MVKVGPAFTDYVTSPGNKRRFGRQTLELSELLSFLPLFLLALMTGIIIARLFYLQVIRVEYYKNLSENNRTRTKIISAPRGIIYDRNGKPLVSNSEIFRIEENGQEKIISREQALGLMSKGQRYKAI